MDPKRRNLRSMLSEAKDTAELMMDLAYASVYFGDPDMAEEVRELEDVMNGLVHDLRAVCILAVRAPRDAEAMSSVLQVVGAIERIANDAVDIARIVTHRLGIPRELVADLSNAEEVAHRVLVREGSHMAHRPLAALELPVATGMRVMAVRREREWIIDVDGDYVLIPGDVLFLEGPPAGIPRLRELAAAPFWEPPVPPEDGALTDLGRTARRRVRGAVVGITGSVGKTSTKDLATAVLGTDFRYDLNTWRFHFSGVLDGRRAAAVLGYRPTSPIDWPLPPTDA